MTVQSSTYACTNNDEDEDDVARRPAPSTCEETAAGEKEVRCRGCTAQIHTVESALATPFRCSPSCAEVVLVRSTGCAHNLSREASVLMHTVNE